MVLSSMIFSQLGLQRKNAGSAFALGSDAGASRGGGPRDGLANLDFADEIQGREQGFGARRPLRGADFARAAWTVRNNSWASRPMPRSRISQNLITPSGLIGKVPRRAMPSSSIITPKLREIVPVGSPAIG